MKDGANFFSHEKLVRIFVFLDSRDVKNRQISHPTRLLKKIYVLPGKNTLNVPYKVHNGLSCEHLFLSAVVLWGVFIICIVNSLQFPSTVKRHLNRSQNRQKTARTNNLMCSNSCLPPVLDILSSSFPSPPPPHSNPLPAHRSWRKHFPDQKDSWRIV